MDWKAAAGKHRAAGRKESVMTAQNTDLKPREGRILEFLKSEIREKGYPPTVREICQALSIKSTSTVHKDLTALEKKGYIRKDPAKPRTLILVHGADDEEESAGTSISEASAERIDVVDVPIIGRVAAGTPILAEENQEGTFPIPSQYAQGNCFMLRVRGESMVNAGIMDGDLILVQQQNTAENGDIVVAMIDGFESEATVKTFYREQGHIRLQPENDTMSPIIVRDVSIEGKVRGVFRYF